MSTSGDDLKQSFLMDLPQEPDTTLVPPETPEPAKASEAAASAALKAAPVKRKPGRPKGSRNKPKDPNAPPKIKRGPGRPKGSRNKPKDGAEAPEVVVKRGRGRPKGSRNKPKDPNAPPKIKRGRGRPKGSTNKPRDPNAPPRPPRERARPDIDLWKDELVTELEDDGYYERLAAGEIDESVPEELAAAELSSEELASEESLASPPVVKRGRGRPKGSRNKPKDENPEPKEKLPSGRRKGTHNQFKPEKVQRFRREAALEATFAGADGEALALSPEERAERLSVMLSDLNDDSTDEEILAVFRDYLILERNAAENTFRSYCFDIKIFLAFLRAQGRSLFQFTPQDIRDFLQERTQDNIKVITLTRHLSALRLFVYFLQAEDLRTDNPLEHVEHPSSSRHLPMVMSEDTVMLFLNAPDTSDYIGTRDKAMLELIYACGLRVSELCNLTFSDLNIPEHYLVIKGKGNKQRIIPMTEAAVYWIRLYVYEFRPQKDPSLLSNYVFLSSKAPKDDPQPMTRYAFWFRVRHYARAIGLKVLPSPHTFRHAFATHLLNHDADLRSLQLLLGHASVTTTQIYTHVALARMHEVYDRMHPNA